MLYAFHEAGEGGMSHRPEANFAALAEQRRGDNACGQDSRHALYMLHMPPELPCSTVAMKAISM